MSDSVGEQDLTFGLSDCQQSEEFAGSSDGFERLWTPHRMVYVKGNTGTDSACPFCQAPQKDDRESLIVHRGEQCFVLLNLFPYNPGHLLVCPYRHVADYTDLSDSERTELGQLTARAMRVVRDVSRPQGFNLGMNQGSLAGAGISEHLHQHVVPRWLGDANFFPIIARTKALPEVLGQTREKFAQAW